MDAFELSELSAERARTGKPWLEFPRVPHLSVGLYELRAGWMDPQSPHTEDEVYQVVRGRATILVGDERRPLGPGSVVFVAAGVPHRFVDIVEDLSIPVFFGPAEGSRG